MARITLGVGTSHGPLASLAGPEWVERGTHDMRYDKLNTIDGRFVSYTDLVKERGEPYKQESSLEHLTHQAAQVQAAIAHLADAIAHKCPDVAIVVGDDQGELFGLENMPAVSIFYGDEVVMHPLGGSYDTPFWKPVVAGYAMDDAHTFPAHGAFSRDLIERLIDLEVDMAGAASVPNAREKGFGHAFGFVGKRLLGDPPIPMAPVLLNTYYPPNTPRAGRCYRIGKLLRQAVEASPFDLDVAIIASGGLSHFLCEEELDRQVLAALKARDEAAIDALPRAALLSGSSEILNWLLTAGAVEHLSMNWSEYVPVRRTPAGTGIGMAFALWS